MNLNVGSVIANLRLDSSQFDIALKTSQQTMRQFSQSMQRIGLYMTVGLTYPLYRMAKSAVKSFSTFNEAIIRAAAVTVGMNTEMRKEMEKTAIQMSKRSLFSATELAEGYFALGQAGYTAAQQINILPTVEQFATAAVIDLDTAIRYLARTSEGLGMAMETPAEMMESMTQVSNAFTFAAITTTAEIEDFAVAMTHAAAPALKLVNKSMKEGISVLMAFARAGIVAEEAGTLLWTTVRDLQRANIKFRSEWNKFGIDVYDKSTRNMRNMADIFSDLEDKFANLSDEAKKASLQMLGFQDRSLRGVQALMGFSDEMKIFQKAMDSMGNLTERVADTYKKSFSAQMKMAKHNIEAIAISIGWILSPFLIKMNEQIKRLATWWESLSNGAKLLVIEIALVVAVAGPLLIIFSKMVATIGFMSIGFAALGKAIMTVALAFGHVLLAAAAPLAIIGLLIVAAYTLRAAWIQGVEVIKERMQDFYNGIKWGVEWLSDVFGDFFQWWRDAWEKVLSITADDIKDWLLSVTVETKAVIAFWKTMGKGLTQNWQQTLQEAKAEYIRAMEVFWQANSDTKKSIDAFVTSADISLRAFGEATKEHLAEVGSALKTQFGEDVKTVTDLITAKIKMMNEQFLKLLPEEDMLEIVIALDKIKKEMKDFENIEVPIERWDTFLKDIGDIAERSVDVAINAFNGLADTIATNLEKGTADWKAYGKAVLQEINRMIIGMMLAEGYKRILSTWEKFTSGGIKQEDPLAATSSATALTTAGTTVAAAIEAAGVGVSASLAPIAPHFATVLSTVGTTVGSGMEAAGITIAAAIQAAGIQAAAAIQAASMSSDIGGAIGSGGGGGGSALGNVFNKGNMLAFASGGIVGGPTTFALANNQTGLMGEAGPEAVMPLSRSASGELGIKATQPNIDFRPIIKNIMVKDEHEAVYEAMRTPKGEHIIVQKVARNRRTLG